MAMSLSITLSNGVVVSYHVITGCNTDLINNMQQFTLQSYVNQDAYNSSPQNSADGENFQMSGTSNSVTDAENFLINNFAKYAGATIV